MPGLDCTAFLQWCLPRLHMRWEGFRKVRQHVCRRLNRRLQELQVSNLETYRDYLQTHPGEWAILDAFCRITITRFYRDRFVFDALRDQVLPRLGREALARGENEVRAWSAGCGSGEEPYTLQIVWRLAVLPSLKSELPLRITATDINSELLERARIGLYFPGSLTSLPEPFQHAAFLSERSQHRLRPEFQAPVQFLEQDIRKQMPAGDFHLILCRNLVLTYFDDTLQREVLNRLLTKLVPGGFLVTGTHEKLPAETAGLDHYEQHPLIYRKHL